MKYQADQPLRRKMPKFDLKAAIDTASRRLIEQIFLYSKLGSNWITFAKKKKSR